MADHEDEDILLPAADCDVKDEPNSTQERLSSFSADGGFENEDFSFDSSTSESYSQISDVPKKTEDYEALDYDAIENVLYYEEESKMSIMEWKWISLQRWIICVAIGILTGSVATAINICILKLAAIKMSILTKYIHQCVARGCLYVPMLMWIAINGVLVCIASALTVYLAPVAAGSGIPQIKCYLNGVKIPNVVRMKTLVTKVVGIIAAVVGGLAVGKEGPMIHSGAVIAAGISQGRSLTMDFKTSLFVFFRNDREKRDFVCAGAAAGVAAAFGAPVGGALFSLEEAGSFWNQALLWRIFLCSTVSSYTLNVLMSLYNGYPGDLSYPGLINFGKFKGTYSGLELPMFLLMGIFGGLSGAAFNALNHVITQFRQTYLDRWRFVRVLEAVIVAIVSATVAFIMMYKSSQCNPLGEDVNVRLQFRCGDGRFNTMAALYFTPPEESVKSLFHDPLGSFRLETIALFVVPYFLLACWTYGLQVPSGLFIPSLLIGAAWGRLFGICLNMGFPEAVWTRDVAKYALMGAAAQLGGTVRMTISLTVILIEATGNISYSLPLMLVLMVAKWVGDLFNKGIYDKHVHIAKVPILEWEPPPLSTNVHARQVMSSPVTTLREVSLVKDVCDVLTDSNNCHGGYPITNEEGSFRGFILRSQLVILLIHKAFVERLTTQDRLKLNVFRDAYPRKSRVSLINVTEAEKRCHIDLRPFLNPAPYTIHMHASLPRIFNLFRALGLRHVVVIDNTYKVMGIITRKDIWSWCEMLHNQKS